MEGIRNNRGDITRRIRVKSGDEVGRLSMAINDLVAQMQTIIRAITESCGHMEEKQTGIISNVEKVNATAEDTTQKLGVMAGGSLSRRLSEGCNRIPGCWIPRWRTCWRWHRMDAIMRRISRIGPEK